MSKRIFDVTVIGAGAIGSSTALSLSRQGFRVCVVDGKGGPGDGSTGSSSGICRSSYSSIDSVRFSWEGYHYWKHWDEFIGEKDPNGFAQLRECGASFLITPNSKQFLETSVSCMRQAGVPVQEWDIETASETLSRLGWDLSVSYTPLRIDHPEFGVPVKGASVSGAIYCPQMGYVSDPRLATQNMARAAISRGCEFIFGRLVTEICQSNGRVCGVIMDDGTRVISPIVLNAAGPYSSRVNELVFNPESGVMNDMKVTTRPMRQEVAYCSPPSGVDMENDGLITADLDVGVYWRPEVGNKILIGGIEPECDPVEWIDGDIDTELNPNLTDNWTNYIYRAALRMPGLQIPTAKCTQGIVSLYDVTPDWVPIYDKSSLAGYYLAIGTSGNQFKNAGVVGELMGKLIEECENGRDQDTDPVQFEMKHSNPGQFVDSGKFSRLRNITSTSGSVLA